MKYLQHFQIWSYCPSRWQIPQTYLTELLAPFSYELLLLSGAILWAPVIIRSHIMGLLLLSSLKLRTQAVGSIFVGSKEGACFAHKILFFMLFFYTVTRSLLLLISQYYNYCKCATAASCISLMLTKGVLQHPQHLTPPQLAPHLPMR